MKQLLPCLLAILSLAGPAEAQTDSVDVFVRGFIRRHNIPAAAISVVHHGKVMKAAGYGSSVTGTPSSARSKRQMKKMWARN